MPRTNYHVSITPVTGHEAPPAPYRDYYPVTLCNGAQLNLPIQPLPGGREAIALLMSNQTPFEVEKVLGSLLGKRAAEFSAEAIVGIPTLGLDYARIVARDLGFPNYVALGNSRKFWYSDELSVPVHSITSPGADKKLYLDPMLVERVAGKRTLIVDDVINTGGSAAAAIDLLQNAGALVVGLCVILIEGEAWKDALAAISPDWPGRVRGLGRIPIFKSTAEGWVPVVSCTLRQEWAIPSTRIPWMRSAAEYIRGLPKAELHVHIEGTLEPELKFQLANKHGVVLPHATVEELRRAYRFANLQSFLDIYYDGAAVLRDADDFHALTRDYLQKAHAQGVVHAEIFFDPQTHTARGIALSTVLDGLYRACSEAQRELGVTYRLILCFLRHLSADEAMRTLEEALPHKDIIAAVGLDSSEAGHPPAKFAEVFARARREGFAAVAHAGEEGPPSYIYEALDILKVRRVDHGVRCEEIPLLVERLARERIPLTVCPLSNVKLKVFERIEDHNLKRLLERGVCVTVNSDDPAYFGGYLLENYLAVHGGLGLSQADLNVLARNSIEASFLTDAAKQRWFAAIDDYARSAAAQSLTTASSQ